MTRHDTADRAGDTGHRRSRLGAGRGIGAPLGRLADSAAVTTRHSASLYPWQIGSALPAAGPVIGLDVLAGRTVFHYDPWELYARRVVTSPNMVVLGQLGKGKSALVKTLLHRQLLAGRQAFVLDPKGEYTALADLHGIPLLRLAPGSPDRLNPLEPHLGDTPEQTLRRRARTAAALAGTGLGRDLLPEERAGLSAALAGLDQTAVLGEVVHRLLEPTPEMAISLSTSTDRLAGAIRPVALELHRLLTGDLAGLIDAPTTVHLTPDGPGLVLDLSAAFGTTALPAVMVCAGAWLSNTLTAHHHEPAANNHPERHRSDSDSDNDSDSDSAIDAGRRQRLLLVDEAWALLHLPATTSWLQGISKLARAHGICLITVLHRVSDLTGQADSGTATQAQARGLLADAETRVLYSQSAGERALLREVLGLTGPELDLVTQLPPHRALWQIGRHAAVVDHLLSPLEAQHLVDTDQQMRRTAPSAAAVQR